MADLTYNAGDRKVTNFKDFIQQLPNEKEELTKVRRSFKKNDASIGQSERKLKYNKVTHKLDDVGESDINDKLDKLEGDADKKS
jgi:Skp family chaperone for outer membrane proteins